MADPRLMGVAKTDEGMARRNGVKRELVRAA